RRFRDFNGENVYATTDAEVPPEISAGPATGLLMGLSSGSAERKEAPGLQPDWPWRLIARGDPESYEEQANFFNADLTEAYSSARHRLGASLSQRRRWPEA